MNSIINQIISLPQRFYESDNNLSMRDLLKKTNYLEIQGNISDIDFQKPLIEHPEYIDCWLAWSDNKKTSSGWFFEINSYDQYIVGYFDSKMGRVNEQNFSNANSACSFFIIKEIDDIIQV